MSARADFRLWEAEMSGFDLPELPPADNPGMSPRAFWLSAAALLTVFYGSAAALLLML